MADDEEPGRKSEKNVGGSSWAEPRADRPEESFAPENVVIKDHRTLVPTTSTLRGYFRTVDENGDGQITAKELQVA
jgi:hypothetical protein